MSDVVSIRKFKIGNLKQVLNRLNKIIEEKDDDLVVFIGWAGENDVGIHYTAESIGEHLRIMGVGQRLAIHANERMGEYAEDDTDSVL